jgi:hypothetical protein
MTPKIMVLFFISVAPPSELCSKRIFTEIRARSIDSQAHLLCLIDYRLPRSLQDIEKLFVKPKTSGGAKTLLRLFFNLIGIVYPEST